MIEFEKLVANAVVNCSEEHTQWLNACVGRHGELRASRPTKASGEANYIWRMISFSLSDKPQHHCMPVMADWYIDRDKVAALYPDEKFNFKAINRYCREVLDPLVDSIVNQVNVVNQPGTVRWARAYGVI